MIDINLFNLLGIGHNKEICKLKADFKLIDKNSYNYRIILDDILYICYKFCNEFVLSFYVLDDWTNYINKKNKLDLLKNIIKENTKERLEDKLKYKWFLIDNIKSLENLINKIEEEKFGGEYVICLSKNIQISPMNDNFLMITTFLSSPDFSLKSYNIKNLLTFNKILNIIFDIIELKKTKYEILFNCKISKKAP